MSSSDALKWLNENFNFVDSVTIIDHSGTIIAKQRFNPRYTDEENAADNQWALGKNLLEVFPGQNFQSSALLAALKPTASSTASRRSPGTIWARSP